MKVPDEVITTKLLRVVSAERSLPLGLWLRWQAEMQEDEQLEPWRREGLAVCQLVQRRLAEEFGVGQTRLSKSFRALEAVGFAVRLREGERLVVAVGVDGLDFMEEAATICAEQFGLEKLQLAFPLPDSILRLPPSSQADVLRWLYSSLAAVLTPWQWEKGAARRIMGLVAKRIEEAEKKAFNSLSSTNPVQNKVGGLVVTANGPEQVLGQFIRCLDRFQHRRLRLVIGSRRFKREMKLAKKLIEEVGNVERAKRIVELFFTCPTTSRIMPHGLAAIFHALPSLLPELEEQEREEQERLERKQEALARLSRYAEVE